MSGFIKFYFQQKQILKGQRTEIISPNIKRLRSPQSKKTKFFVKQTKKFLDTCKFKQTGQAIQRDKMTKLKNYNSIRKKLIKYSKSSSPSVFEIACQDSKNKGIVSVEQDTNKVYLLKKYNVSLALKLQALYQAQKIEQQKQNLKNWKNCTSMNALNSPNYKKMNFLLEKIYENKNNVNDITITDFKLYTKSNDNSITKSSKNSGLTKSSKNSGYEAFSTSKTKLW